MNPDEFYVHKPMLKAGRATIRRNLGSKLIEMVFYAEEKGSHRQAGQDSGCPWSSATASV